MSSKGSRPAAAATVDDRRSPTPGLLAKPARDLQTLERLVAWLKSDVLGPPAAEWLDAVIDAQKIRSSRHLIEVLAIKWPNLIQSESRSASMAWLSSVVSEEFLLDAPARLFPYLVYGTLLDRQPTKDELKDTSELEDAAARRTLLKSVLASAAYATAPKRRTLLRNDDIDADVAFELRYNDYQTLLYHRPTAVPADLFTTADADQDGVPPVKGIVSARFDNVSGRLVVDPNVSIVGKSLGGNRIEFQQDWIVLGPRVPLDAGKYMIVVDVSVEGGSELTLDLVSSFGTKALMAMTFRESLRTVIPVELEEREHAVELRLLNREAAGGVLTLNDLGIFLHQGAGHLEGASRPLSIDRPSVPRAAALAPAMGLAGLLRALGLSRASRGKKAVARFVSATRAFDGAWYVNRYEDVRAAAIDPLKHYLDHGMAEGRLPNATFDPIGYASRNPGATPETAFIEHLKREHPALAKRHLGDA